MPISDSIYAKELSLLCDTRFNVNEFSQRWLRARKMSIRSVLDLPADAASEEERVLLQKIQPEQREMVLKSVFDLSRKLGVSLSRHLSLSLETQDFADLLPLIASPCYAGHWHIHNEAQVATRSGCGFIEGLGSFGCDYWREALDGLVMGASDDVRLARHRSVGHGDADCVDVLFFDKGSGPKLGKHRGEVPAEYSQGLEVLVRQFQEKGIALKWEGYSEGVLFYRMEAGAKPLCGAGGRLMHGALQGEVKKYFPGVELRDGSPLAVIGDAK